MERFKASTAPRYHPIISLRATLECDAVVRTVSDHKTFLSLISPHVPLTVAPHATLVSAVPAPPAWLDLTRRLEQTLSIPTRPSALVSAYAEELENVTAVSLHDSFSDPTLIVLAAWVGETGLLSSLSSLSPPPGPQVLLVTRNNRQDDAARDRAIASVAAVYGQDCVHLVHLNDDGPRSPPSTAAKIDALARAALIESIADVSKAADRARRAARPTFRSWFSTPPPRTFDEPVSDRRLSLSGRAPPRFPADSLEATTRKLADLYMIAGRYSDAADMYRALQSDLRGLVGSAIVHEASALEMTALSLALVDSSKQAIGAAFEKAISAYCASGRRDLAVRATLRAVDFCTEAGYPDSAAGVSVRAMKEILSEGKGIASPAGSPFIECALAVLCTACCVAYRSLHCHRRASLYAFLGSLRLFKLRLYAAAACLAGQVDDRALFRRRVRQHVNVVLGKAEAVEKRHSRAVSHFVEVMTDIDGRTELELQGDAVRNFLASVIAARDGTSKRWDSGSLFPLIVEKETRVVTRDASNEEEWEALEDEVLEDAEHFRALENDENAKRDRRVEVVAEELRQRRHGENGDPGGSLESKIERMRELSETRRKRRRAESMLERRAVVDERITVNATLRNPLQFPIFLDEISAVVSIDGQVCHKRDDSHIYGLASVESDGETPGPSPEATDKDVLFFPAKDVTLLPASSNVISVHVIVKRPCTVQVIGMHWKFTVGMGGTPSQAPNAFAPGFCILQRRGPRLNNTRRQRASEVPMYAEDESLSVQVQSLAPHVKTKILFPQKDNFDARIEDLRLYAGETREGRLLIENDGQMPLHNIVVRVGTPRTFFMDVPYEVPQSEDQTKVFAVDSNGGTPRQRELIAAARIPLNLLAGERKEIPIWIRAAVQNSTHEDSSGLIVDPKKGSVRPGASKRGANGTAPCMAKVIIAYGDQKVRIARFRAVMEVRPSLRVSPRFLRPADSEVLQMCGKNLEGVLLGIEVEHAGPVRKETSSFEIKQLSLTSKHGWKPKPLLEPVAPVSASPDTLDPSESVLRKNETATFFILVVRENDFGTTNEASRGEKTWLTCAVPTTSYMSDTNVLEANHVDDAQLRYERALTHFVVSSHRTQEDADDDDPDLVYVSVEWTSGEGSHGAMNLPPIHPLACLKEAPETAANGGAGGGETPVASEAAGNHSSIEESIPIHVRVSHVDRLDHDFKLRACVADSSSGEPPFDPAVVPVEIHVKNVSVELVDVYFEAEAMGGVQDGDRGRIWSGEVSKTLRAIAPGAERVVNLTAVLLGPGRFNLAKFTISYQSTELASTAKQKEYLMEPSEITVSATGDLKPGLDFINAAMRPPEIVLSVSPEPSQFTSETTETPRLQMVSTSASASASASAIEGLRKTVSEKLSTKPVETTITSVATSVTDPPVTAIPLSLETQNTQESPPRTATSERIPTSKALLQRSAEEYRKSQSLISTSFDDTPWTDADTDESD